MAFYRNKVVTKEDLRSHMFATYTSLRVGMAILAFTFPILLYLAGIFEKLPLQGSMSAYYWATLSETPPSKVWFIGGLFAIGSFLYLYKGFTAGENIALNFAAIFAFGVAYFPMEWNCDSTTPRLPPLDVTHCVDGLNPHGPCAGAMFACLAYVTFLRSRDTLPALENASLQRTYRNRYWFASAVMIAAPFTAGILHIFFEKFNAYTYFLELIGIWAFALYWAIKSFEMRHSQAEKRALQGTVTPTDA